LRWRSPAQLLPCGRCWASAKDTQREKGTAVNKKYQKKMPVAPDAHGLGTCARACWPSRSAPGCR